MFIEKCLSYNLVESTFIKYFDRLNDCGYSFDYIKDQLPSLDKYYKEIVLNSDEICSYRDYSLEGLFKRWKEYKVY